MYPKISNKVPYEVQRRMILSMSLLQANFDTSSLQGNFISTFFINIKAEDESLVIANWFSFLNLDFFVKYIVDIFSLGVTSRFKRLIVIIEYIPRLHKSKYADKINMH